MEVRGETGPTGVVLLNMGGPDGPGSVRPFLESMFSDPGIMPLPALVRPRLARVIAARRAPASAARYGRIGGASPIHAVTRDQAAAVQAILGGGFMVRHAFRHCAPRSRTVAGDLAAAGVWRAILVPLYPQRSRATTDSAIRDFEEAALAFGIRTSAVRSFPEDAGFVASLAAPARAALAAAGPGARVLMTAHSMPRKAASRGAPYLSEVRRTAQAVAEALPPGTAWSLAFQSRVSPVGWVGPAAASEARRIGREGARALVVIPLSFACENLETLLDLDVELREVALASGIRSLTRVPAPGTAPSFVEALARLARMEAGRG